jgi:hypothetical protein
MALIILAVGDITLLHRTEQEHRAALQRALARHGRRDAVRVRRLYAAEAEPVGRSAVYGAAIARARFGRP